MPIQPVQFTTKEDIKKFLIKQIRVNSIRVRIEGDYRDFSKIKPENLHREFIVATNNKTYLLSELLKLTPPEVNDNPNLKNISFQLKTGEIISFEQLRKNFNDANLGTQTLALLNRNQRLSQTVQYLVTQLNPDTNQEEENKLDLLAMSSLSKSEAQTRLNRFIQESYQAGDLTLVNPKSKQYFELTDETVIYKFIVDRAGDTYYIDDIKNMSQQEANQSSITFLCKDGSQLTLGQLKSELQQSDAVIYKLIHNKPLIETLLLIKPEALEKGSNLPLRLKLPSCPIMHALPVLNPVITFKEDTYELYAMKNWIEKRTILPEGNPFAQLRVNPSINQSHLTHPGSSLALTKEEVTPNNALHQLILFNLNELLEKRIKVLQELNKYVSSSKQIELMGKIKNVVDQELFLYKESLDFCNGIKLQLLWNDPRNQERIHLLDDITANQQAIDTDMRTLINLKEQFGVQFTLDSVNDMQNTLRTREDRLNWISNFFDKFSIWKTLGAVGLGFLVTIGITIAVGGGIIPLVVFGLTIGVGAIGAAGLAITEYITKRSLNNSPSYADLITCKLILEGFQAKLDKDNQYQDAKAALEKVFAELKTHNEFGSHLNELTELLAPFELEMQTKITKEIEQHQTATKAHPADLISFNDQAPGLFARPKSESSSSRSHPASSSSLTDKHQSAPTKKS